MGRLFLITSLVAMTALPAAAVADRSPCAPFDKLALGILPTTVDPGSQVRMSDLWKAWSLKAGQGSWPLDATSAPQFRIETSETFVSHPHAYEVRGAREGHVWSLRAREVPIRHQRDRWGPWRHLIVTAETARRLDRLLDDPCLWTAPSYLAATLPLAKGGWVPDFDGPSTYFDVRDGGRQWAGVQISWVLGVPGELRNTALNAAFGRPMNRNVAGAENAFAKPWYSDARGEHPWVEPRNSAKPR